MVSDVWQDTTLGEFVTLRRGHDLPEPQRKPGNIPVLGSFGITGYHNTTTTKSPGVTIGRSGASFGVVSYSPIDFWALNTALYVIDFHGNDELFAYYFLKSIDFQRYNSGGAQPSLNRNFIYPIPVKVPPLPEQKTIAQSLSDVDALITECDRIITKKRNTKQGMMQQLLTGKKRLPGFSSEWAVKTFDEVMTGFSSGSTPSRRIPHFYKGNIKWITSGELNYKVINDTYEKITEEAVIKTNLTIHEPGTFFIAITGLEAVGTRGSCGINGTSATTNQSCMALYPKKEQLTIHYLFYSYVNFGENLALKFCQGTKQQSYNAQIVKKLPIYLPPTIEEQKAITQILSDMDAEIAGLEQKRDKYKNVKQGMMQELLTGKTRLKYDLDN